MKNNLWNENAEIDFFNQALNRFCAEEKLFYKVNKSYYAYLPKGIDGGGAVLNDRNSLIGNYTEKWCKDLLSPIAAAFGLYAINGVVCEEIGLTKSSNADLAFCSKNEINQKPENI